MKSLSRILAMCLCATPFVTTNAVAVVAKNAGHNLTAYEPSNAYNNQWASLSNGRSDVATNAKVDFGNCNALILRCAQPKCANGGCTEMGVASAIVAGCVQSNKVCEQYGNDLITYMSAQLVANSTAKVNAQNAAATQAAQEAQSQQIAQMQQQMQSQLAQMQQQMEQQNAATQQQVQAALEQQAQQNAAALENMASQSTASVAQQPQDSGLSSYQEEAVARGISNDILERQKITGQIMTEIENAENSLTEVQKSMIDAFEYAGCDRRGNNCTGPKRVKKFRERALNFIDPYDNVIDKIYDALETAQMVGVDLSEIYLLLNDSCNRWGEYLCPRGTVVYDTGEKGQKTAPKVCDSTSGSSYNICVTNCTSTHASAMLTGMWATLPFISGGLFSAPKSTSLPMGVTFDPTGMATCLASCAKNYCQPCTLLRTLGGTDTDGVYYGWINAETTSTENQTVIACASNALNDSYIGRRTRRRRGTGIVDIDHLEQWLSQVEPGARQKDQKGNWEDSSIFLDYCGVNNESELRKAKLSKALSSKEPLCVDTLGKTGNANKAPDDECSYINRNYALCDTHLYNADVATIASLKDTATRARVKEIIALKVTVITEQMYKQYEFLAATLRRLKTHLEKSVLTANLQAAGASYGNGSTSDSGSGRGGSGRGGNDDDKNVVLNGATNCSAILDFDQFVTCLQSNVSLITTHAGNNSKEACVQLQYTLDQANSRFTVEGYSGDVKWVYCDDDKVNTPSTRVGYIGKTGKSCQGSRKKQDIINCANEIVGNAAMVKRKINASNRGGIYIPGS